MNEQSQPSHTSEMDAAIEEVPHYNHDGEYRPYKQISIDFVRNLQAELAAMTKERDFYKLYYEASKVVVDQALDQIQKGTEDTNGALCDWLPRLLKDKAMLQQDAYNQALEDVMKSGSLFITNKEIIDLITAFIISQCRKQMETKGGLKGQYK